MNPIRKFKWFMFSCVFLFTCFDVDSKTLIHAGKLIDGKSDRVQSRISIVVDGNTIADIQEGFISSNDFENYIDLRNHTVLPGLMDMHVHFGGEYLSYPLTETRRALPKIHCDIKHFSLCHSSKLSLRVL